MPQKRGKIVLDCDLMQYPHSGLYHYCLNIGNYVNRHLKNNGGKTISFYIPESERESFEDSSNCIVERKWHHKIVKPFLWNCDIWHAPFQSGRIIPMNNKSIKVLLTIHDLNCLHEDKTAKERRLSLQHTQKLIDRANAIVCISNHCKKDVIDNLDIADKQVYVIHNGTHHVKKPPSTPKGYKPCMPFIFTMGYVNRKKNFHSLIPLLLDNPIEIVVAGRLDEPDYISNMKKDAEKMGVLDRLKILGPVSEEDKAWYLSNCKAFSLPSLAEGFGAPVVEAMVFGKPLFLSNFTSLPEIGGDVAFYFKSFDPDHMNFVFRKGIEEYNKNGLAQRIIDRGMEFNWEHKAAEYCTVYESMISLNK